MNQLARAVALEAIYQHYCRVWRCKARIPFIHALAEDRREEWDIVRGVVADLVGPPRWPWLRRLWMG